MTKESFIFYVCAVCGKAGTLRLEKINGVKLYQFNVTSVERKKESYFLLHQIYASRPGKLLN